MAELFVANEGSDSISIVAASRLLRTVVVGPAPVVLAVDERHSRVVVGHDDATVSMLDATSGRVVRTISLAGTPTAATVDAATGRAFVITQGAIPGVAPPSAANGAEPFDPWWLPGVRAWGRRWLPWLFHPAPTGRRNGTLSILDTTH